MIRKVQERIHAQLKRLNEVYFSDSSRMVEFPEGYSVMRQGEPSRRIYLILEGEVIARRHSESELESNEHEVFRAGAGSYVGVQSFFSGVFRSSNDIISLSPLKLAYMDDETPMVEEETFGTREEQFLPILLHELQARNTRILEHATQKEQAQNLLQRTEMAATLGQLSAGIAHELNNAIGVLSRRSEFVADFLCKHFETQSREQAQLFLMGLRQSRFLSAAEFRALHRSYERQFKLCPEAAKVLARIAPDEESLSHFNKKFIEGLNENFTLWELGHDLHDIGVAARHAAGIVDAVKLLGGGNHNREEKVNVVKSIQDAMTLLVNRLKKVGLKLDLQTLPDICADVTELVQVWANLIKNACDAMEQAQTPEACISISSSLISPTLIRVVVEDNGPGIPLELQEKIFQPNFTTKRRGSILGLVLGSPLFYASSTAMAAA